MADHDCSGIMCFHKSHFDEGGDVHEVKGNPIRDPDPQKAKDAMAGAMSGGPSMSQGWQNLKNEVGSMFGSNSKAGYAKGGDVEPMEMEIEAKPDMDNELMESCGHECMEAMKKGDVKGFLDAIKAIVMSMKE